MGKIYIAKPDGWFLPGTRVELVADCEWMGGIFRGERLKQNGSESSFALMGEIYIDEELCPWDEFDVIEEKKC